jgi:hypothetical protein
LNHRIFQTRSAGFSTLPPRGRLAGVTGPFPQPLLIKRAIFSWYLILEKDGCYRKCRGGPAVRPRDQAAALPVRHICRRDRAHTCGNRVDEEIICITGPGVRWTAPTPGFREDREIICITGPGVRWTAPTPGFREDREIIGIRGRASLVSLYTCECGGDGEIICITGPGVRWTASTPVNVASMRRSWPFGARAYADLPLRLSYGQLVLGIALPRYAVTDRPDHLRSVARRAANPISTRPLTV